MDVGKWESVNTALFAVSLTVATALSLGMIYQGADHRFDTYLVEERPGCLFTHNTSYQVQETSWCKNQIDNCAQLEECSIATREKRNGFHYYLLTQEDKEWNLKLRENHIPDYPLPEGVYRA